MMLSDNRYNCSFCGVEGVNLRTCPSRLFGKGWDDGLTESSIDLVIEQVAIQHSEKVLPKQHNPHRTTTTNKTPQQDFTGWGSMRPDGGIEVIELDEIEPELDESDVHDTLADNVREIKELLTVIAYHLGAIRLD